MQQLFALYSQQEMLKRIYQPDIIMYYLLVILSDLSIGTCRERLGEETVFHRNAPVFRKMVTGNAAHAPRVLEKNQLRNWRSDH